MASGSWDQRGYQTNHIIVHIAGIPQCCSWCGHNCWYNRVDLLKCWME